MKELSLANRVALLVALTAVVLLGSAAAVMDHLVDAEMQGRFDSSLLVQAHALAALIEAGPHGLEIEPGGRAIGHPLVPLLTQTFAARCANGSALSQGSQMDATSKLMQSLDGQKQPVFATIGSGKERHRAVLITFIIYAGDAAPPGAAVTPCHFLLMQPNAQLNEILLKIDAILIAVPASVLVLLLVLSPWLVRRGLKPLTTLREHMQDIGPQQPGRRLPMSQIDEIEPLVERFNEVLERMDEGVLRERRFAGAVAHETRTHLAKLRTLLDVELRHPSPRPISEVLGEISDISSELESTVTALLLLTRLEAGIEILQSASVRPTRVLEEQLSHLRETVMLRRLQVSSDITDPDVRLDTDRNLLKLIIANLVVNAVVHAPLGDRIEITVTRNRLCIRNHAPGLDADDIGHLGQRHWQKSHDSDTHAGLGLSLAGAAAKALGLSLTFALVDNNTLFAELDWSEAVHIADAQTTRQQPDGK